jgi:hypothetical protein
MLRTVISCGFLGQYMFELFSLVFVYPVFYCMKSFLLDLTRLPPFSTLEVPYYGLLYWARGKNSFVTTNHGVFAVRANFGGRGY